MSFMKGDVLTKARKLVKGLAMSEPTWLKAMQQAPPATFPRVNEIKRITLPEDVYVKKFYKKHPDSLHEDAFKFRGLEPPPARVFAQRVLELKDHGVSEQDAMAVADMEYRMERKGKKKAYARLKQIAKLQGKRPPPNPYPSAIKEIQALERPYVRARFFDPEIRKIAQRLEEERAAEMRERGWGGIQERGGGEFEEKRGGDLNFQEGNGAGFRGREGGGFPGRRGGFQGFQERGGGFF